MAIKAYMHNGIKFYEVYVNGLDARGVRFQKRKRGIETLRKAELAEFEMKRELAMLRESKVPYRWSEWCEVCLKRMKLTYRPSTCVDYETRMKKWIHPRWGNMELNQITRDDVYTVIFEHLQMSEHSRKTILKIVRRLFEMAVEEGILD